MGYKSKKDVHHFFLPPDGPLIPALYWLAGQKVSEKDRETIDDMISRLGRGFGITTQEGQWLLNLYRSTLKNKAIKPPDLRLGPGKLQLNFPWEGPPIIRKEDKYGRTR